MARTKTEVELFESIAAGTSAAVRSGLQNFTLTDDHVTLLRAANVSWDGCEFGAPCIDPKRPYGNSSGIEVDIALSLGWEVFEDADGEPHLTREQRDQAVRLHEETETALQVVLRAGSFTTGDYTADAYSSNWRLVRATGLVDPGRLARLEDALGHIADGADCTNFRPPSSCRTDPGRRRDATEGATRWCDTCVALDALTPKAQS